MKILVIAPHADDEVLGCGGTIINHVNFGDEVYLCEVTKPYTPDWTEEYIKNKSEELKRSCQILGIKEVFSLCLPTVKLDTVGQKKLNDMIAGVVLKVSPDVLYIPFYGDINKDHRIVSEACLVVARPRSDSPIKKVFAYETLSETEWGQPFLPSFKPNVYVNISRTIEDKISAMAVYKTQIKKYPHPRSPEGVRILSQKRGMESGLEYAEAFMLLREIK